MTDAPLDPTPDPANQNRDLKNHASDWRAQVPTRLTGPILLGLLTIGIFFAGFGYWAIRAPLSGAAIATGVVVASGQNQEISHLEGGIIREIAVRSGDTVKKGQPLIFLDETIVQAERNRVNNSLIFFKAEMARARAELADAAKISFGKDLEEKAAAFNSMDILELQRAEYQSRRNQLASEIAVLAEQISAIEQEIAGVQDQRVAERKIITVLNEEIAAKETLLEKGLTPRNQYNALLRTKADTEGSIGRLTATIGQRRKAISELKERQTSLKTSRKAEASALISQTRGQIADLEEQLKTRADTLERMVIRAPAEGVIVTIGKNTIGSVVQPGEPLLEILPTSSELIIEARVSPQDVDVIQVGQEANVRFIAFNARTTPEVRAVVDYVSADRIFDPVTREPYFDARLKLAENLPPDFDRDKIFPGMPVDAFINTGERTFVEYLVKPVTDSFSKAFKEE